MTRQTQGIQFFLFSLVFFVLQTVATARQQSESRVFTRLVPGTDRTVTLIETKPPAASGRGRASTVPQSTKPISSTFAPRAPELVNLTVTKDVDGNIVLSYAGGSAPYMISYSPDPSFQDKDKTLAANFSATTLTIPPNPSYNLECFAITDASTVSPAVQGIGYDPAPLPEPSQTSSGDLWWGTLPPGGTNDPTGTLTIDSNYLDPIPSENVLFLNFTPVRAFEVAGVSGNYASQASFRVPDDARSSFLSVLSHGTSSPAGTSGYQRMVPRNLGLPFAAGSVRGVSFNSNTTVDPLSQIWVAHGSQIQLIDVFLHTPGISYTVPDLMTKPYIARVSTAGVLRYIDGVNGVNTIRQISCGGNPAVCTGPTDFANTHTALFTRNILPVGLACEPDGSFCYLADGSTGKTVKIPANNATAIVDNYGNHTWSFPDPCPIDVDPATALPHWVVLADNTPLAWAITGTSSSSAFAALPYVYHHFEIDRDVTDALHLRVSGGPDPGSAEAFNRHTIDPDPANNPAGQVRNLGARIYGTDDGVLDVAPDDLYGVPEYPAQQVIINNSGQPFWYPSADQTADRIIRIAINWWTGVPVRLELIDVPDTAGYAPIDPTDQSTWPANYPYEVTDNKSDAGDTFGITLNSNGSGAATVINAATAPSNNTLVFYLKVPARYSGNNFQIRVVKKSAGGALLSSKVLFLTGMYTSWKREYVERDKMFRQGGVLVEDCTGCSSLLIASDPALIDGTNMFVGDQIVVFDEAPTKAYETAGPDQIRTIVLPGTHDNGNGSVTVPLDAPLPAGKTFFASGPLGGPPYLPRDFAPPNAHSGGVGVISGCDSSPNQINTNSCFYDADMRNVEQPFDDAFVQFLGPRAGMNAMPYVAQSLFDLSGNNLKAFFSQIWFSHFISDNSSPPPCDVPHDYIHVIGASKQMIQHGVSNRCFDWSYVFIGSIETVATNKTAHVQSDSLHEKGHQFAVNACTTPQEDTRSAWCDALNHCGLGGTDAEECLMYGSTVAQVEDGMDKFDVFDLLDGDPNCAPGNPTPGAIRTDTDPQ